MATSENKAFSVRLKEAAGAEGIYSATELARLLGLETEVVKSWYSGSARPNGKHLANLCSLLHVRFEWLVYGKTNNQDSQSAAGYNDEMVRSLEDRFGPLLVGDEVASAIYYIVTQPPHVHISDIVVRPTRQDYP